MEENEQNERESNAGEKRPVGTERIVEEREEGRSDFVSFLINAAVIALFAVPVFLAFTHSQNGQTPWNYAVDWYHSVVAREKQNLDGVK